MRCPWSAPMGWGSVGMTSTLALMSSACEVAVAGADFEEGKPCGHLGDPPDGGVGDDGEPEEGVVLTAECGAVDLGEGGCGLVVGPPGEGEVLLVQVLEEGVPVFGGGVFEGGHIDVFGGLLEGGFPGVQEVLGFGGVVRGGGDFDLLGLGPGGDGDVEGFLGGGSLAGGAQQVDGADGVGGGERFERCGHGVSPSAALSSASALRGAWPWAATVGGVGGCGCRCRLRLGRYPGRCRIRGRSSTGTRRGRRRRG